MFRPRLQLLITLTGAMSLLLLLGSCSQQAAQKQAFRQSNPEMWRADLHFLVEQMQKQHPNLFFAISHAEFETAVEQLDQRIPSLTDNQIIVELMKLIALPSSQGRDGHSMAFPPENFQAFPLRPYWFNDGLYILDAQVPYQESVGARLTAIGNHKIEAVYEALGLLIPRDNDMSALMFSPVYLMTPELLQGLGIIQSVDEATFHFEETTGRSFSLTLSPVSGQEYIDWAGFPPVTLPKAEAPLYVSQSDENFWFTFLADSQSLYIQFNQVSGETQSGESLTQFRQRIAEFVVTNPIQRTIIDLRHNLGGDNTTYGPLLRMLSQNEVINQPGKLYTIIGRHTFSAGGNFATDLEKQTHTRFVGEPTGGSPNQYGDAHPFSLPNSGLKVRISTRYHQPSQADDERLWHEPSIPTSLSSTDFFNQRDPAMEAVLMDEQTSSVDKFSFQPDKVPVGTVYHYLKTNIDGSIPEHISLYVASQDRLEAFKFHPGGNRAGLVTAEMDWATYSAKTLESWQVFAGGKKNLFAVMRYLASEQAIQIEAPSVGQDSQNMALIPVNYLPFHMYNFDLSSLNFAMPHLRDPESSFRIGLTDPTFRTDGPLVFYRGEVTVRYVGDEPRNDALSRKYRIDGPGLENRGGFIWVNKVGGYVEDIEIDLPDNPDWQSFKLRLQRIEQMEQPAWEAFMEAQF